MMLNMHGNYLNSPCWNLMQRGNRIAADLTHILSPEDLKTLSVEAINTRINEAFVYDDTVGRKSSISSSIIRSGRKGSIRCCTSVPIALWSTGWNPKAAISAARPVGRNGR